MHRTVDRKRMLDAARTIRENISRARGYLRRDDLYRCIDAASEALNFKIGCGTLGLGRSEIELLFAELCDDFSRHPRVIEFLKKLGVTSGPFLRYKTGSEGLILKKMAAFRIKMKQTEERNRVSAEEKRVAQKEEWVRIGKEFLKKKNFPKGKVYLRRVAETYGNEPGVIRAVGKLLFDAGLLMEAAEMFKIAIQRFPNDSHAWRMGINTYNALGEFKKAEGLYLNAIRVFGGHPVTYLNIAKFYLKWHRKDDAYDYATRALDMDPNLAEAKAIREKTER